MKTTSSRQATTPIGNKTSKDKAPNLRRVNVSLDPESITTLRAHGDGELSLGIRRAAKTISDKEPK